MPFRLSGILVLYNGVTLLYSKPQNDVSQPYRYAVFVVRSVMGNDNFTYTTTPYFSDVPASNLYFPWIQKMKQFGITSGCTPTTYCPDDPVTRGQMAVFIMRGGFNLLLPPNIPGVAWASPASASPGRTVTVTIVGQNTNFANGLTQVSAGAGITVSNISVAIGTTVKAQFTVATGTTLGPRSITVTTGSEEATCRMDSKCNSGLLRVRQSNTVFSIRECYTNVGIMDGDGQTSVPEATGWGARNGTCLPCPAR